MKFGLGKGQFTIIDEDDFDLVNRHRWYVGSNGYVESRIDGKKVFLHRLLNKTPDGLDTDHINRDKLDNRRSNLRTVSRSDNNVNRKPRGSVFKTNQRGYEYWKARLIHNKVTVFDKTFKTEAEARLALEEFKSKLEE